MLTVFSTIRAEKGEEEKNDQKLIKDHVMCFQTEMSIPLPAAFFTSSDVKPLLRCTDSPV